ncbi:dihydroxyacetone kinase phosphoryl donor subunit DhaM [Sodalis sp. RH21]|uniref:dihydroxyacetone kinase phosphoryl donor subunit DhaM n=1 Tax=unclassified Sodalis (in: enterobacteria) TaxID=2636512 RepID=UPI0039B6E09C
MVNIVVVSHSLLLAQGVEQLAGQMMQDGCRLAIAAGVDDAEHPIGTDAIKVMEAIESVDDPSGVLVLMDLGSALLSAETALDLLAPDVARRVRLCAAPLVEGALAAVVAASAGGDLARVRAEALGALAAKMGQLAGQDDPDAPAAGPSPPAMPADSQRVSWTVLNPNGLHVRPAAKLAGALAPFQADLRLEKAGRGADPRSLNQLAALQIRQGDTISLLASGPQAAQALEAFSDLARQGFGEAIAPPSGQILTGTPVPPGSISAPVLQLRPVRHQPRPDPIGQGQIAAEIGRMRTAIAAVIGDLGRLAQQAVTLIGEEQGAIFSAHQLLLDDEDLLQAVERRIKQDLLGADAALARELMAIAREYGAMEDLYLRARELDVRDILNRLLGYLAAEPPPPALAAPVANLGVLVIAGELFPSEMIAMDRQRVKGIGLERGDILSHSAILARALGIPMVVGLSGCLEATQTGQAATLDPAAGTLSLAQVTA